MNNTLKQPPLPNSIDALLPSEMALACEAAGAAKAGRDALALIVLGVLAGAFIALGAIFMTVVLTGAGELPWGVARLLAGLVFSLGLILVIVGGAELFTGDSLMIVACASRRITLGALLRAWSLVYVGNIAGAVGTAALVFLAGQHGFGGGAVGKTALAVASAKAALPTIQLFFLAVLCNVLVCLAVWMSFGARSTTDKIMVIVPPDRGLRRRRIRALDRQSLSPALRPCDQGLGRTGVLDRDRAECGGLSGADRERRTPQHRRRDHRQSCRRQPDGGRGLLVRVSAPTHLATLSAGSPAKSVRRCAFGHRYDIQ